MALDYNPSGGAGAGNAGTTLDGVNLLAKLLNHLIAISIANLLPSGSATETKQDLILERLVADTWTTIPGNIITMTYYAAGVSGNPGTSLNNAETAVYSNGSGTVFTQTFTYDANNNILTVTVS